MPPSKNVVFGEMALTLPGARVRVVRRVDGTLIQAWAGYKSFVRKDGNDENGEGGNS